MSDLKVGRVEFEPVIHTPGPWTLGRERDSHGRRCINHDGYAVALACARASSPASADYPQQEANARLIAAAPELLAELVSVRNWIAETHGCECDGEGDCALCSVTAAIAKAEGLDA